MTTKVQHWYWHCVTLYNNLNFQFCSLWANVGEIDRLQYTPHVASCCDCCFITTSTRYWKYHNTHTTLYISAKHSRHNTEPALHMCITNSRVHCTVYAEKYQSIDRYISYVSSACRQSVLTFTIRKSSSARWSCEQVPADVLSAVISHSLPATTYLLCQFLWATYHQSIQHSEDNMPQKLVYIHTKFAVVSIYYNMTTTRTSLLHRQYQFTDLGSLLEHFPVVSRW